MSLKKTWLVKFFSIWFLLMFLAWTIPSEALARRGMSGGRSFGSRSSRTMKSARPNKPRSSTTGRPKTQSRPSTSTPRSGKTPPTSSPRSSYWRGLGGGLVGGLAGGMLARWLFGGSSEAQAATKSGGYNGPGLLDLILLVGIGLLIYSFIRRRRGEVAATQAAYQSGMEPTDLQPTPSEPQPPPTEPEWDLEKGLTYIQQLDPLFTEDKFRDQAMDYFFKIQGAWADRDMSTVKHLLTEEMYQLLDEDTAKMRADGLINRLENMAIREVNITEAWQESGQDFITMRVYANLLDYTVDEKSGEVVSGSKIELEKFEEYWSFTRPVGNNPWQLSAISQAE